MKDEMFASGGPSEVDHDLGEILGGLAQRPKRLPCKLFYDARGSELFERITELPEYYPTRTETEILRRHAPEMAGEIGPGAVLVELGSGSATKTRILLDALARPRLYLPIDISPAALEESAERLAREYPALSVRPTVADYTRPLRLPLGREERSAPLAGFFPGSTIGNFEPSEAVAFMRRVRRMLGERHTFLIGVDLPKARRVLEAAYDDAAGVTRDFNLNILDVLNRRYSANFVRERFAHRAVWNAARRRVEMHLVSRREQVVNIAGHDVLLGEGEPIVTEHCHKYELSEFARMARGAGYEPARVWTDPKEHFSVHLLRVG